MCVCVCVFSKFITHARVQTTDLGGCGKLFFLNMCNPLIDIHDQFEFLKQLNGSIAVCAIVLYDITILQQ